MSAGAYSFSRLPPDREILVDLLHSLSQPLTSLRCALELSIEEVPADARQQQTASAALQQTESVIGMIQLMRDYLNAEEAGCAEDRAIALMPVLKSVGEDLASIAAVRGIRLRVAGTCAAKVQAPEPRLRLALQYLIMAMIDRQPSGTEITLLLGEGAAGAMLRAQGECSLGAAQASRSDANRLASSPGNSQPKRDSARATVRRVRLAIAARVFETAGAALAFDDGTPGFVLRIPRPSA